jgi:hypothetical protein
MNVHGITSPQCFRFLPTQANPRMFHPHSLPRKTQTPDRTCYAPPVPPQTLFSPPTVADPAAGLGGSPPNPPPPLGRWGIGGLG